MDYEDEEPEYTEVHSGTGKILGVFVGLVMVCAVFFGLGYTMGKSSAVKAGSLVPDAAAATTADATTPDAAKPSPAVPADSAPPCPQGQDCSAAPAGSDQMTFYKSVEQKDANAQLTPPPAAPADKPAAAPAAKTPAPAPASVTTTTTTAGYIVQVAAVTKPGDADALVDALHHKQYPAFVTTVATDKLLHVQVGPFADVKDAEAMKARLASDGYNPILKK
jgi:cell division septation protein DedD